MSELHQYYKDKGFTVSDLGTICKSETARYIEKRLPELEKDGLGGLQKRFFTKAVKDVEPTERTEVSVITTSEIDRDSEIVLGKGINLKEYDANRLVLWNHDQSLPPVGKNLWIKYASNQHKAKTFYPLAPEGWSDMEWDPSRVYAMVCCEPSLLPAKSIGFMAEEAKDVRDVYSKKEIETNPALSRVKRVITKATLLEYSVVVLPANRSALVEAVGKGFKLPAPLMTELKQFEKEHFSTDLPIPKYANNIEQYRKQLAELKRMVKEQFNKDYMLDTLRGKF